MSISDVHNPKAAAELIQRFRKRFSTKICMAPHTDHNGSIVSAHTLSVEAMLRKIAVDSRVYAAASTKRIARDTFPIEIKKLGLRDVSVFNGFCQKHDTELFSCLENEPFRFTKKQNFMLAYRATARECYLKRKQYESLPTPDEFAAIHGIEGSLQLNEDAMLFQAGTLSGAEDAESLKSKLDRHLLQESWHRLVTRAIIFPKTPTMLATAAFQPFFDMNGIQLQDFEDLQAEMSQIIISLIPLEMGGAAIFSWLDTADQAPELFFRSVAECTNLTASVIHAVLDNTENFALNPEWYEKLTQVKRDYLFLRVVLLDSTLTYFDQKRPDKSAPFLDDWGHGVVAQF